MYTCVLGSTEFYLRSREATVRIAYRFFVAEKKLSYNVGTALFRINALHEDFRAFACSTRNVSGERELRCRLLGAW